MGSSRFPGKPLALILGIPMVEHCLRRTELAGCFDRVVVATCDSEIAEFVEEIGGDVVLTADTHTRATTRTAEAVEILESEGNHEFDVVVMVQGDEALIPPSTIAETLPHFKDPDIEVVNIMSRLQSKEQFRDHNNVKVVINRYSDAMYFSREPIPSPWKGTENIPMYMQTGIIAFRKQTLIDFNGMAETLLEQVESVDMNRVIENGGKIRMVLADVATIGIDTPEELLEAEKLMKHDPILDLYKQK